MSPRDERIARKDASLRSIRATIARCEMKLATTEQRTAALKAKIIDMREAERRILAAAERDKET